MRCPHCGEIDTQVKDSRPTEDNTAIRRRRYCTECGERFTTFERVQLRELTEQALLTYLSPSAALVNEQGDILYLHGRTGMFLEMAPGEVGVNNILKMAREGLKMALTVALRKAAQDGRQRTWASLSASGRKAFVAHLAALQDLAAGARTAGF